MIAFPDTSFLFALYRPQHNSAAARKHYATMSEAVHVSSLLLYEFRQSVRSQTWLHSQNSKKGIPEKEGANALADLETNLADGALVIVPVEWPDVHHIADQLSSIYTKAEGHRALDILHVATALQLGAQEFLSFDDRQRNWPMQKV